MFCGQCGTKIPDDAIFCAECGARISDLLSPEQMQDRAMAQQVAQGNVQGGLPSADAAGAAATASAAGAATGAAAAAGAASAANISGGGDQGAGFPASQNSGFTGAQQPTQTQAPADANSQQSIWSQPASAPTPASRKTPDAFPTDAKERSEGGVKGKKVVIGIIVAAVAVVAIVFGLNAAGILNLNGDKNVTLEVSMSKLITSDAKTAASQLDKAYQTTYNDMPWYSESQGAGEALTLLSTQIKEGATPSTSELESFKQQVGVDTYSFVDADGKYLRLAEVKSDTTPSSAQYATIAESDKLSGQEIASVVDGLGLSYTRLYVGSSTQDGITTSSGEFYGADYTGFVWSRGSEKTGYSIVGVYIYPYTNDSNAQTMAHQYENADAAAKAIDKKISDGPTNASYMTFYSK